jgi:hypothetical protein
MLSSKAAPHEVDLLKMGERTFRERSRFIYKADIYLISFLLYMDLSNLCCVGGHVD